MPRAFWILMFPLGFLRIPSIALRVSPELPEKLLHLLVRRKCNSFIDALDYDEDSVWQEPLEAKGSQIMQTKRPLEYQ